MKNKKYVLWNTGICPIASKVRHVTLATTPLGSFIVPYVVLTMAYYMPLLQEYGIAKTENVYYCTSTTQDYRVGLMTTSAIN